MKTSEFFFFAMQQFLFVYKIYRDDDDKEKEEKKVKKQDLEKLEKELDMLKV